MMIERSVKIVNKNGLHARPAAEVVKAAAKFKSEITIVREDLEVNGKSIMGVMMLAAEFGSTVTLRATGPAPTATRERRRRRAARRPGAGGDREAATARGCSRAAAPS